jgi:hypothetical protein
MLPIINHNEVSVRDITVNNEVHIRVSELSGVFGLYLPVNWASLKITSTQIQGCIFPDIRTSAEILEIYGFAFQTIQSILSRENLTKILMPSTLNDWRFLRASESSLLQDVNIVRDGNIFPQLDNDAFKTEFITQYPVTLALLQQDVP